MGVLLSVISITATLPAYADAPVPTASKQDIMRDRAIVRRMGLLGLLAEGGTSIRRVFGADDFGGTLREATQGLQGGSRLTCDQMVTRVPVSNGETSVQIGALHRPEITDA